MRTLIIILILLAVGSIYFLGTQNKCSAWIRLDDGYFKFSFSGICTDVEKMGFMSLHHPSGCRSGLPACYPGYEWDDKTETVRRVYPQ